MALPGNIESKHSSSESDTGDEGNKARPLRGTDSTEPLSPHAVVAGLETDDVFNSVTSNKSKVNKAYEVFRKSPEAVGIVKAIIDDTIGSGVRFEYVGPDSTPGTSRINDARSFWQNGFHLTIEEAMADALVAGDAYIFENLVQPNDIKSVVDAKLEDVSFNNEAYREVARKKMVSDVKASVDEDNLRLQGSQVVPASTMYEDIDENGNVERFIQRVAGKSVEFSPGEIVHIENMPLEGEVYSFTPMISMLSELITLANIKDYHAQLFMNAGLGNNMYKMPNETPNSQNFNEFISQLRSFRKNGNMNKDLVTTGEIERESLNDIEETMEFENLGKYITNVLLVGWNMPPSRLGIDVSGNSSEGKASQMSMEGYYKRIEREQKKWETILNNELFEPYFNCHIKFESPNVKQDIRKADRDMKRLNASLQMAAAGLMTRDDVRKYMGIEKTKVLGSEDMSESEFRRLAAQLSSGGNDGNDVLSNSEVNNTVADDESDEERSETQERNEESGETDQMADNA